jgi:hypothetical protein
MDRLAERMDSRVRASRAVDHDPFAEDSGHGSLKHILHGFSAALALPSAESRAIVGDKEAEFHG